MSEYSIDASERPEDKMKGRIGAGIVGVLILVFFVFPFFKTVFPIPEAEGLMASFGNVEYAGGNDSDNPNPPTDEPQPQPTPPTEPVVDQVEDVETVEDENSDPVKTTTDPVKTTTTTTNSNTKTNTNSEPKKTVNTNAVFGGGGKGDKTGPGTQGNPLGKKDIGGGNGLGDQGDGTGKVGNRKIQNKCDALKNWDGEQGHVWVMITVNEDGKVIDAEAKLKTKHGISTITNSRQWKIAEDCAKEYQYQSAAGKGTAKGSIPIFFKRQ